MKSLLFLLIVFVGSILQIRNASVCWTSENEDPSRWFVTLCENSTSTTSAKVQSDEILYRGRNFLENKTLVMVGDSLMRYQYLNLIHSLYTNSWDESEYPHLEHEKEWIDWKHFLLGSTNRFGCREICDCYRYNNKNVRENRHYFDQSRNISVHNFYYAPGLGIFGNNLPTSKNFSELCEDYNVVVDLPRRYDEAVNVHDWYYFNHIEFIQNVIAPIRADILVMNIGHLANQFSKKTVDDFEPSFFETLRKSAKHVIWKSTTARCDRTGAMDPEYFLKNLEKDGFTIFDAYSITEYVARRNFEDEKMKDKICWDDKHFNAFVYRELNKQFLLTIESVLSNTQEG